MTPISVIFAFFSGTRRARTPVDFVMFCMDMLCYVPVDEIAVFFNRGRADFITPPHKAEYGFTK
jgi:hypothetical protein